MNCKAVFEFPVHIVEGYEEVFVGFERFWGFEIAAVHTALDCKEASAIGNFQMAEVLAMKCWLQTDLDDDWPTIKT